MPNLALIASTIFRQMSLVKPIGSPPPVGLYENGIWLSRPPIEMPPLALILASVSLWASAAEHSKAAQRPNVNERRNFIWGFRKGWLQRILEAPIPF